MLGLKLIYATKGTSRIRSGSDGGGEGVGMEVMKKKLAARWYFLITWYFLIKVPKGSVSSPFCFVVIMLYVTYK